MVEKTNAGEGHGNIVFVAGEDHIVIAHRTACLCDIFDATLVGALNIVAKGEECVRTEADIGVLTYPVFFLIHGERLRLAGEELLPYSVPQDIIVLLTDVDINGVVAVGATDIVHPREIEHLLVLAKPPCIGLITGQTSAMYAALLSGTDADGLAVLHVANRITLGVF